MVNGWLAYQTLAAASGAASAFYQSGGAFGFRDQLQDAARAAAAVARPDARARSCCTPRHQFVEGDVLHWWHPPLRPRASARASPTTCSGCRYLTAHYVARDRRRGGARRARRLPRPRRAARTGRGRGLRSSRPDCGESGGRLRALLPRPRPLARRRRARPAALRHRRLERRHEPRRPRGPRRERLDGLLPGRGARRLRAALRRARRRRARRAATARTASDLAAGPRTTPAGTATGTGAATTTTARRSARTATTSAASTRWRRPGRCSPASRRPARADAAHRRGRSAPDLASATA